MNTRTARVNWHLTQAGELKSTQACLTMDSSTDCETAPHFGWPQSMRFWAALRVVMSFPSAMAGTVTGVTPVNSESIDRVSFDLEFRARNWSLEEHHR